MIFAIGFTNFGPYHLARLRALATTLAERGDRLIAYEMAGSERTYPWQRNRAQHPFDWITLFPDRVLESLSPAECRRAIVEVLERDRPDAVAIVGYSRPESMAAARWANRRGRPAILMSESQAIDRPRVWWKELVKRRRVSRFSSAVVGGTRHRDYLVDLGMPADRISLGYNAVDNDYYAMAADNYRRDPESRLGLPRSPYFLSVSRFVGEKNLVRLIEAFARYRDGAKPELAWDLVLCGDGPGAADVDAAVAQSGWASAIHRPGFLQADALARWYAHAGAFLLASLSEPWGLVVNEAAAAGLPLLVSDRAGCAPTFLSDGPSIAGARFDPADVEEMTLRLCWMAHCSDQERQQMGKESARIVAQWGPGRFAEGTMEALELATDIGSQMTLERTSVLTQMR